MTVQPALINQDVLRRFRHLLARDRLAHAYLFAGPQCSGKAQTALAVAKLLNCDHPTGEEAGFCDACPSCRKIDSGNHPDVTLIETENSRVITIDQIRGVITRCQLRPFEGKKKVYIIKEAERLSLEGSNAVLKTLEEPVKDSVFILTTAVLERVLSTIKSRCHSVHFFPLGQDILLRELKECVRGDEESAHFYAFYSEGCAGKARSLHEAGFLIHKNQVIDHVVFQRDAEPYLKTLLADQEKTQEALNILLSWFRDVVLMKQGVGAQRVAHRDRLEDLARAKQQYTTGQLFAIIDEIVQTKRMLQENLNVKIAFYILRDKIWIRS
ncbi:MAG TPA: DNA polymerase III subunit [Candidatus Omnitrophota bacterium]|nr:DNA polymerase III subunit [Candidatus Omnitrophota bacterium]